MGAIDDINREVIAYRKAEMNDMFAKHKGSEIFKVKLSSDGGSTKTLNVSPEEMLAIANILIHAKGEGDDSDA